MSQQITLLEKCREVLRTHHYAASTERAYLQWIRVFIRFHRPRHSRELPPDAIEAFLTHLANARRVAPKTQNQALNAIIFLYTKVLAREPGDFGSFTRARVKHRLPVVLSREKVRREITVRSGRGDKDRRTVLPDPAAAPLHRAIARSAGHGWRRASTSRPPDIHCGTVSQRI